MQRHPEQHTPSHTGKDGKLDTDLARLFSLNNVEEVAYLDFSRERAEHRSQRLSDKVRALPAVPNSVSPSADERISESPTITGKHVVASALRDAILSTQEPEHEASCAGAASLALPAGPSVAHQAPHVATEVAHGGEIATSHEGELLKESAALLSPALAVYSIAGGVGKSTLCAHLARALHDRGERVLLVDANGLGMLPLHFGADDMHTGLRRFRAPGESQASILVASDESPDGTWLRSNVEPLMQRVSRTIFDLSAANDSFLDEALRVCQIMLVPLLPDLSSLLTLIRINGRLKKLEALGLSGPKVQYILNRYDSVNESHRKAKDMILSQIGDDLLTVTLCASDDLGSAFEQRMTVADLAPTSPLTKSYADLARWLREQAPPLSNPDAARWSEL